MTKRNSLFTLALVLAMSFNAFAAPGQSWPDDVVPANPGSDTSRQQDQGSVPPAALFDRQAIAATPPMGEVWPSDFSPNVHWSGFGGDIWNTNSSPYTVDATRPFDIEWRSESHDGDYHRPSGVVLADVGGVLPVVLGSTGWGGNRAYRCLGADGSYLPWTAQDGINDSGTGFRVALSLDGDKVFHIDDHNIVRAYSTILDPHGVPLWTTDAGVLSPGINFCMKVGPDGRIYGHRYGTAALDPVTGARAWWSASNPENALYPGAFWQAGSTYHYVVAGRNRYVSAYDIQSSAGSGPVWSFYDTEIGYAPPTVDPATGAMYAFRSSRVLKLSSSGGLVWRSATVGSGEIGRSCGALSRDRSTYYYQTGTDNNTGKLYAFRTSDGTIKWTYPTNAHARDGIGGPVVSANGLIFVGNAAHAPGDNRVFCIEDSAGVAPVVRGVFDLRDEGDAGSPSIAIGPGGIVYFDTWAMPNDAKLFAFRTRQYTLPAPTYLAADPLVTTARVSWDSSLADDSVGYLVYRREVGGEYPPTPTKYVGAQASFSDYGLQPATSYEYRVASCNADGAQTSPFSSVTVTTLASSTHVSRHASRDVLIVIYTGGYTPAQVSELTNGLELGLEFYWRTSNCTFHMDPTWLYIDTYPPGPDWYSAAIIEDLRNRGVQNDQYDLAYMVGNGLAGCLGGYVVFGSTCASLGSVCGGVYPAQQPGVNYVVTWTYTHEIHHALEAMQNIAGPTVPDVITCHFPWAYPDPLGGTGRHIDMAADFDGIAGLNRDYGDSWLQYPAPHDGVIECRDEDRDGLPDADDRVWMDEARFGSGISGGDGDDDGLGDLAEYCRYNFRGCSPDDPDTDDDGIWDGADEQPLYKALPRLNRLAVAPAIDGALEADWPVFATGYYFTKNPSPMVLETFAGWRDDGLYMAFRSDRMLRFKVSIDGSGQDGRWESPVRHVEGATDTDNLDHKDTHIGDSWGDGRHIVFSYNQQGVSVFGKGPIANAQVASTYHDGHYETEVRIPRTLPGGAAYTWYPAGTSTPVTDGLTLEVGQIIGLNVTCTNLEDSADDEFSGTWTSLFETFSYCDLELVSEETGVGDDVVVPSLMPGLYFANPYSPRTPIILRSRPEGAAEKGAVITTQRCEIAVYDILGRRVRTLYSGPVNVVSEELAWDGRDDAGRAAAAGVYLVRAATDIGDWQRKLVLVK